METIDGLPPETRFVLRCLSRQLTLAEAAELLATDAGDAAKRLRRAGQKAGFGLPPASDGQARLLEAVAPLVAAAGAPPVRTPGTPCPSGRVAQRFAHAGLTGPLLLATAEHVADCSECLDSVLRLRAGPHFDHVPPPPERPARATGWFVLSIVLVVGLLLLFALG